MHGSFVLLFDHLEISDVPGIAIGISALLVLLLVTISSNQRIIHSLHPGVWKKLQMTSYVALMFAVSHFYLMEQKDGVLVIKRSLGKITYGFAAVVILVRLLVVLLPKKDIPKSS
jgi:DMSO/TMAO reductase YedYZ heme-binding membrane subunit